ncbi:hypothetical protein EZJ43_07810 [Pedobacter changchengzhani]|uniref:Uncharacterized protein n=1 Tax=Pedobacter changchengzhani TaxID=2529274 RepID=A0A4R5MMB3_9SPHI|nr:hypothetical protein [Pedobacter changchengzhani]TDG36415.1 hypothetical protein EZJ43_07810 [Pedobacter changchengzhani]
MRIIFIVFLSVFTANVYGQVAIAPPMSFSKSENLSLDAYKILKANKFLDFANADTLKEVVDGKIIKTTPLKTYFSYRKDWAKIEAEDTTSYRRKPIQYSTEKYDYTYTDTTMTETYIEGGAYGVHKEIKTVYNPKGFLKLHEIKVFINDNYVETRTSKYIFDDKNRAIKIVESVTKKDEKENKQDIITAVYEPNQITVTSENGKIELLFSKKIVIRKQLIKHPPGQDKNVYRAFSGTDNVLMSIALNDDEITISEFKKGLETTIKEKIFPTKIANVFYVDIQKMQYKKPNQGNYYLLAVNPQSRKLEFFLDTGFVTIPSINNFLANKENLTKSMSVLLISELNLEEYKSLPPILQISESDKIKFKALDEVRYKDAVAFDNNQKLTEKDKMKLMLKQLQILSFNCLLLNYQPPNDKESWDFLRSLTKK